MGNTFLGEHLAEDSSRQHNVHCIQREIGVAPAMYVNMSVSRRLSEIVSAKKNIEFDSYWIGSHQDHIKSLCYHHNTYDLLFKLGLYIYLYIYLYIFIYIGN